MIKVGLKKGSFMKTVSTTKRIMIGWKKDSVVNAMKSIKIKVGWQKDSLMNAMKSINIKGG